MTFDTWWKEHGSLHNDVFKMSTEAREVFKRVSKTAWDAASRQDADYTYYVETHKRELARLKELKKLARKAKAKRS